MKAELKLYLLTRAHSKMRDSHRMLGLPPSEIASTKVLCFLGFGEKDSDLSYR